MTVALPKTQEEQLAREGCVDAQEQCKIYQNRTGCQDLGNERKMSKSEGFFSKLIACVEPFFLSVGEGFQDHRSSAVDGPVDLFMYRARRWRESRWLGSHEPEVRSKKGRLRVVGVLAG